MLGKIIIAVGIVIIGSLFALIALGTLAERQICYGIWDTQNEYTTHCSCHEYKNTTWTYQRGNVSHTVNVTKCMDGYYEKGRTRTT